MKKSALIAIALALSFVMCSKRDVFFESSTKINHIASLTQDSKTIVSINDVINYINRSENTPTKSGGITSVIPIIDKYQDTLLFLINYEKGWSILSGDKRTPAVIASSEVGSVSLKTDNQGFLSWLNSTALDIKRIRQSADEDLSFSKEEIQNHIKQWKDSSSRWVDPDLPIDPPDTLVFGQWVLVRTEYYNEPVNVVPHMLSEQWDQGVPYNYYCPTYGNNEHYYVGCAGVAAGAMLHHLYKKNNYPTSFSGIPMDSIAVEYSSVLVDSLFVTARYLKAINDVMGLTVPINYFPEGTFALPSQVSSVFSSSGYTCTYDSFDALVVKNSLLSNKPIIALAFDELILNLPNVGKGHYFIIDGYMTERPVTARHYMFLAGGTIVPSYDEVIEYEYGPSFLSKVKMNWGWGSQWKEEQENDGWYYLTGSWVTTNGTFDISRHMFYNFERL